MQPTDNQMNDRSIPCFSLGTMDVISFTTTHRALISSAVESAVYWAVSNKLEEVEVFNTNLDYERIFYDIDDLFDYLEDELSDYFDDGHTNLAEGERDIFARYFQDNYEILLEEYFNQKKGSFIEVEKNDKN